MIITQCVDNNTVYSNPVASYLALLWHVGVAKDAFDHAHVLSNELMLLSARQCRCGKFQNEFCTVTVSMK